MKNPYMTVEARQAYNEHMREYRRNHKDQVLKATAKHWQKVADQKKKEEEIDAADLYGSDADRPN